MYRTGRFGIGAVRTAASSGAEQVDGLEPWGREKGGRDAHLLLLYRARDQ